MKARPGPKRGPKVTPFGAWWDARPDLKVEELAKLLDVTPATTYNLRAGRVRPSLWVAARIEKVTNGEVPASAMTQKAKRPR